MEKHKHVLSKRAVEALERELNELLNKKLPKITKQIQAAREFGDLRENAEYTSARNEQSIAQNRVDKIREILANYVPEENAVQSFDGQHITDNVIIKYRELDDQDNTTWVVKLVSKYEADPIKGKVSVDSPLGKSLMNRKKGDIVYIKGEIEHPYKVEILDVYNKKK